MGSVGNCRMKIRTLLPFYTHMKTILMSNLMKSILEHHAICALNKAFSLVSGTMLKLLVSSPKNRVLHLPKFHKRNNSSLSHHRIQLRVESCLKVSWKLKCIQHLAAKCQKTTIMKYFSSPCIFPASESRMSATTVLPDSIYPSMCSLTKHCCIVLTIMAATSAQMLWMNATAGLALGDASCHFGGRRSRYYWCMVSWLRANAVRPVRLMHAISVYSENREEWQPFLLSVQTITVIRMQTPMHNAPKA